ncbi:hypothetical protein EVAR_62825_1 [Eumeta japonica]|uniref:Uncharacterized protein n=1 Tax=Eumeta variegata TaxID=151549 RepID=A0A4C2A8E2_EUMVA|nr:hypothetical protein EVAR_62825_1 [Eumeta japonica]
MRAKSYGVARGGHVPGGDVATERAARNAGGGGRARRRLAGDARAAVRRPRDDIDNATGALTNHMKTVVDDNSLVFPANSVRKELSRDVRELIRAKNAALRQAREFKPCHKAYWGLAKALKTEGVVSTPALRKPDNSIAFDDREKA